MQYRRIMCLDFGDVRIGIAFSDLLKMISSPYDIYVRKNETDDLIFLNNLIKEKEVDEIVIGLPLNMDGTYGERAEITKNFGLKLENITGIIVHYVDERLSSVEAEEALKEANVPSIKWKGLIDKVAASIILQTYLNSKK